MKGAPEKRNGTPLNRRNHSRFLGLQQSHALGRAALMTFTIIAVAGKLTRPVLISENRRRFRFQRQM